MYELPLQLLDDFLIDYHIGHVLILVFVLAVVGGFAINRSTKVLGIQLALFGVIFMLTPSTEMPPSYLFFGLLLVLVGPVIIVASGD